MTFLKTIARKAIFPLVTFLGAEKLLSAYVKNKDLVVMYHGVVRHADTGLSVNHLSITEFEEHIIYLKANFNIVPLSEIFEYRRKGLQFNRKTIAITFDDGYENNFTNAFPVLKKYNLPATIFMVSSGLQNENYVLWYDYLDILKSFIDYSIFPALSFPWDSDKMARTNGIANLGQLRACLKTLNQKEKWLLLDSILPRSKYEQEVFACDPEFWKMLRQEQLREMIDSGLIEIGSHTVSHPNLDTLDPDEMTFELSQSKVQLEQATNIPVQSIAFPDGAYNEKAKSTALNVGYRNLVAVIFHLNTDRTDANIISRFCISNTTTVESNMIQIHSAFRDKR